MRSPSPARRERPSIREPLQVVVRIRPLVGSAAESGAWRLEQRDGQHWVCHQPQGEKLERGVFPFDQCFDGKATNKELFDKAAKKLVQAAVAGSNASILAYGQTSSGKTHSVLGTPYEPGILPLAVEEIFGFRDDGLQVLGKQAKLSYFEIFNEKVIDLLAHGPSQATSSLPVKEDAGRGFYVQGLREAPVRSAEDVLRLVARGEERRRYARTRWNDYSSRSHAIFSLCFEGASSAWEATRRTKLNIVDLAGCENHKHEASEDGRHINRSLFFLGEVISRLCKDGRRDGLSQRSLSDTRRRQDSAPNSGISTPRHSARLRDARTPPRREKNADFIPYRDSKLTRVLRSSLGGDALTLLLVTVHPSPSFAEQSLTSLRFATKARSVDNFIPSGLDSARSNEDRSFSVCDAARIIEGLQEKLRRLERPKASQPGVPDAYRGRRSQAQEELHEELQKLRLELRAKERELAAKAQLLSERDRQLGQLKEQLHLATRFEHRIDLPSEPVSRHEDSLQVDAWPHDAGRSYADQEGDLADGRADSHSRSLSLVSRAEDIPCLRSSSFVTRQQNLPEEGSSVSGGETQEELVEKLVRLAVMQISASKDSGTVLPAAGPQETSVSERWSPEFTGPGLSEKENSCLPVPANPDVLGTPRSKQKADFRFRRSMGCPPGPGKDRSGVKG